MIRMSRGRLSLFCDEAYDQETESVPPAGFQALRIRALDAGWTFIQTANGEKHVCWLCSEKNRMVSGEYETRSG